MGYHTRLSKAFLHAPILPLNSCSRYCLFSDCHRGNGTSNDNFLKNCNLYYSALRFYCSSGFTYIEIGDGDELWENRKMSQIMEIHCNVFCLLSKLYCDNRLYFLYGNHDMEKKKPGFADRVCVDRYSGSSDCSVKLFPNIRFYEGIILESSGHSVRLYLTHGHQADFWNSTAWKVNRFLVRYIWRPLEHFGVLDPTNAAKNYKHKSRIEKRLSSYAKVLNNPLITGHTHRPRLNLEDSLFINTGSCVHPDSITCIEIEGYQISLIKWSIDTKNDRTLYVKREVLSQSKL